MSNDEHNKKSDEKEDLTSISEYTAADREENDGVDLADVNLDSSDLPDNDQDLFIEDQKELSSNDSVADEFQFSESETLIQDESTLETPEPIQTESSTDLPTETETDYPFSLLIEGPLKDHEKEKLLDILSREKAGIRELDLEPQFESDRVLIPRVNETIGIIIVQSLRDAQVQMTFGPSDQLSQSDEELTRVHSAPLKYEMKYKDGAHPAESLPLVPQKNKFTQYKDWETIDSVMASATLNSTYVEATDSPEYERLIDALSKKLKYEAYIKGAKAVLEFSLSLTPLDNPTQYKVMAMGAAARPPKPKDI